MIIQTLDRGGQDLVPQLGGQLLCLGVVGLQRQQPFNLGK